MRNSLNLKCRYRYKFLGKEEKRLYRFMVSCLMAEKYRFVYKHKGYSEFGEVPPGDLPVLECKYPEEFVFFDGVYDAVLWDFPELFYIRRRRMDIGLSGLINVEPVNKKHRYTHRQIEKIRLLLDEFYHRFDGIEDVFGLECALQDYVIAELEYREEPGGSRAKEEGFTVAGPLLRGRGVCSGFSRLCQYVFMRRGIMSVPLLLSHDNEKTGHAWLAVELYGNFYHLDVTLNKTASHDKRQPQMMHFNITDKELLLHFPEYAPEKYLSLSLEGTHRILRCKSTALDYYRQKGLYFDTAEAITQAFGEFAAANDSTDEAVYFYFKAAPVLNKAEISRALWQISHRLKNKKCLYTEDRGYYAVEIKKAD